ncbi:MAG TPA: hypothetical protein DEA46_01275 [Candidatus Moranbacteria bacterium]|nr:hypothetical protein [Candidatus Moranbacteria bacterium]
MGKKKIKLRKRDAERIAEFAAALTKELGIFGRIAVSNCKRQVMAEKKVGSPYPVTLAQLLLTRLTNLHTLA